MQMIRRVLPRGVMVLALVSSGCAAERKETPAVAPMPPAETSPPPPARRHFTEIDALEHDLAVSETRLLAELERRQEEKSRVPISDSAGKAGASALPRKKDASRADDVPKEKALESRSPEVGAPCDLACRALASMRASANGICSITGPADARCVRAQERVKDSAHRIAQAGCVCQPTP